MEKRYLLNTNSKKVHDNKSSDGRCQIKSMREEYKVYFDTLEEALEYPNKDNPLANKCSFCIKK